MFSNLPDQVGERELRTLLEPFGQVCRVVFVFDRGLDRAGRVAFVEMDSAEAAASAAMAKNGCRLAGHRLTADTCLPY